MTVSQSQPVLPQDYGDGGGCYPLSQLGCRCFLERVGAVPVAAAMFRPEDVGRDPAVGMRLGDFSGAGAKAYV